MGLGIWKFFKGIRLVPKTSTEIANQGELEVLSGDGKLGYHNGTSVSDVVTEKHASQGADKLENKDLDDTTTAIVDSTDTSIKIKFDAAGITGKSTTITSSQTDNRVITLPDATGTVALTANKLSDFAATTSAELAAVITDETGTGKLVFASSPTLTTPTLGVASATSVNKVAITAPATGSTLTIADGKTLTANNTMTLAADADSKTLNFGANNLSLDTTGDTTLTLPTTGTLSTTSNKLSDFAATTSAELASVISDETGSGALVFGTSPSLTTPTIGVATATSVNKVTITAPANSATLTIADGKVLTANNTITLAADAESKTLNIGAYNLNLDTTADSTLTLPTTGTLGTLDGAETLTNKKLSDSTTTIVDVTDPTKVIKFDAAGTTGTSTTIASSQTTNNVITLPDATGTVALTSNKISDFAAVTSAELAGKVSDETGTGSLVFANTPTLVAPVLGVASATSINKVALTEPATGSTLTIADGKTLTVNNSLTLSGTDSSSVAFGTGGTVAYTSNKLSAFAATTSAELAGVISDETGSGKLVFDTSPTLTTPTLGAASATSINKVAITAPATSSTLTIADGKTLTANNTITLAADADSKTLNFGANNLSLDTSGDSTLTLPTTGTLATLAGTEVFTNKSFDDSVTSKQIATPSSPSADYNKLYTKSDSKLYILDSSGSEKAVGGGTAAWVTATAYLVGDTVIYTDDIIYECLSNHTSDASFLVDRIAGKWARLSMVDRDNYITNGRADIAVTPWVAYADAAAVIPADGTAGSPDTAITRNTTTPLAGDADFLITKQAGASRQGEGVSYDFTIDSGHQSNILTLSLLYSTSANYGDGDIRIFLLDITNSTLIYPADQYLYAGDKKLATFQFQTSSNSTSYRLIFHIASDVDEAWTMNFTNVFLGVKPVVKGAVDVYLGSYTMSGANLWTANAIYTARHWRKGDRLLVEFGIGGETTPTGGNAAARLSLPLGLNIDMSKKPLTGINVGFVGSLNGTFAGVGNWTGDVRLVNSSTLNEVALWYDTPNGGSPNSSSEPLVNSNIPAVAYTITGSFEVPILGWSSNMTLSEDSGNRDIVATAKRITGAQTITSGSDDEVIFNQAFTLAGQEQVGGVNYDSSTGRFAAPETAWYDYAFKIRFSCGATAPSEVYFYATINNSGTVVDYWSTTDLANSKQYTAILTGKVKLTKGQYFSVRGGPIGQNIDINTNSTSSFAKRSSPQTIAASPRSMAVYGSTNGQNSTTATYLPIIFNIMFVDDDNGMNTSTGVYTVKRNGVATVTTTATFVQTTSAYTAEIVIIKNAATVSYKIERKTTADNLFFTMEHTTSFPVNIGDTIVSRVYQTSGGNLALTASNENVRTSIKIE